MNSCAFLTMDSLDGFIADDELAVEPLAELGWQVEFVPWRQSARSWSEFDAVVVRSTWDYHEVPREFLGVLREIDSRTRLLNPAALIRWNLDKNYMAELRDSGIPIVPTRFGRDPTPDQIMAYFGELDSDELVFKPAIGASACDTFRLPRSEAAGRSETFARIFRGQGYLVQPYLVQIASDGEYSTFFFGGEYSHSILKTPRNGDFRVQEEHGGLIEPVEAPTELIRRALEVLGRLDETPLYARVDLVREGADYQLMELELIEPALYFRTDPESPSRFARALAAHLADNRGKSRPVRSM